MHFQVHTHVSVVIEKVLLGLNERKVTKNLSLSIKGNVESDHANCYDLTTMSVILFSKVVHFLYMTHT